MPDDVLKTVPDKLRRLEARVAQLEDHVEVLDHRRSTFVPSRSYANLSGRQREIALVLGLIVLGELVGLVARHLDAH